MRARPKPNDQEHGPPLREETTLACEHVAGACPKGPVHTGFPGEVGNTPTEQPRIRKPRTLAVDRSDAPPPVYGPEELQEDLDETDEESERVDIAVCYANDWLEQSRAAREKWCDRTLMLLASWISRVREPHTPEQSGVRFADRQRWYTPREVAAYVGVATKTIREAAAAGELRGYRVRKERGPKGQKRYRLDEVDAWLQTRRSPKKMKEGTDW